jgi:hypothetical protein
MTSFITQEGGREFRGADFTIGCAAITLGQALG